MSVISVQFSVYPLDGRDMVPIIECIESELVARKRPFQVGAMSTMLWGDSRVVFAALEVIFALVAAEGAVVMNVTASNCCPLPENET